MKRERGRYIAPVLMLLLLCSRETGRSGGGATASPLMVMSVTGRRGASAAAATLFLPLVISTIFSPNPFSYFFFLFLAYTHSARALSLSLSRGDVIVVSVGDGRIATRIRSQLSLSETRRHRLCRFSAFHRLNFGPLISISPPCSSCAFNLRVNKALLSPASLRRERKTTEREREKRKERI